jgi:hypothetical protein
MCRTVQRNFTPTAESFVRLEFPHTEVQHFGDVAIVWSQYLAETETNGNARRIVVYTLANFRSGRSGGSSLPAR